MQFRVATISLLKSILEIILSISDKADAIKYLWAKLLLGGAETVPRRVFNFLILIIIIYAGSQ